MKKDPPASAPPPPHRRRSTASTSSTNFPSPFFISSSKIPFSWEQTPGIPKLPSTKPPNYHPYPIPFPPLSLRSNSFTRENRDDLDDPFAAALVRCVKNSPDNESLGIKEGRRFGFGLGLLDLYESCKASCLVAESTVEITSRRVGPSRVANRRD